MWSSGEEGAFVKDALARWERRVRARANTKYDLKVATEGEDLKVVTEGEEARRFRRNRGGPY